MHDEDDLYDGDDDETEECGAYGAGPAVQQWQRCQLAGTEHCDWECRFARRVRATLAEEKQALREKRRSKKATDMFTPNAELSGGPAAEKT